MKFHFSCNLNELAPTSGTNNNKGKESNPCNPSYQEIQTDKFFDSICKGRADFFSANFATSLLALLAARFMLQKLCY